MILKILNIISTLQGCGIKGNYRESIRELYIFVNFRVVEMSGDSYKYFFKSIKVFFYAVQKKKNEQTLSNSVGLKNCIKFSAFFRSRKNDKIF